MLGDATGDRSGGTGTVEDDSAATACRQAPVSSGSTTIHPSTRRPMDDLQRLPSDAGLCRASFTEGLATVSPHR
ncbi:hypothetical protein ACN469_30995 [Corallococcus terminator]